jgi:hypothetical protein
MSGLLFFLLSAQVFCFILLIRNQLVFKYRTRASNELYTYQMNIINTNISKHTQEMWELLNKPSYITMLFMITCWTYKSFYGNLQQRMKEITDAQ